MDDPVPSTSTNKRGQLEGGKTCGQGYRENSWLFVKKGRGFECNKEQAEVIAEWNWNYDELSSSGVAPKVKMPNIVEDEELIWTQFWEAAQKAFCPWTEMSTKTATVTSSTYELAKDDLKQFDLSTPKRESWYQRGVLQIFPGSTWHGESLEGRWHPCWRPWQELGEAVWKW
jgi:hypothetical protein